MRTFIALWITVLLGIGCVTLAQQEWQPKTPIIASLDDALSQVFRRVLPGLVTEQSAYRVFPSGGWYTGHWVNTDRIVQGKQLISKAAIAMRDLRQFPDLKFAPSANKECTKRLRGTFTYYQPSFNNPSQAYTAFFLIEGGTGEFAKKPYGILNISIASYPPSRGEPCQK